MIDVNTVVGEAVETPDGVVIIPVSRITCGFAAGGSEMSEGNSNGRAPQNQKSPLFGGGSGAGVAVHPVAFLVVGKGQVRLLPVEQSTIYDRLLDVLARFFEEPSRSRA